MVAGLFHFVGSVSLGGVRSGVAAPHSRSHRLQLTFDTVIASVAKQSRARVRKVGAPALGCFVAPLLAMTEHERESASARLASGVAAQGEVAAAACQPVALDPVSFLGARLVRAGARAPAIFSDTH